uniref:Uncharacterized protein n=1 Tax=Monopterus albus TaxID=43700 RepID=A0A3Q3JHV1_MONAL
MQELQSLPSLWCQVVRPVGQPPVSVAGSEPYICTACRSQEEEVDLILHTSVPHGPSLTLPLGEAPAISISSLPVPAEIPPICSPIHICTEPPQSPTELQKSSAQTHPDLAELQSPPPSHLDPVELQSPSPSYPDPAELQNSSPSHLDPAELQSPSPSYPDPAELQNSPPSHPDPAELPSPSPSYPDPAELQNSSPSHLDPAELQSPSPSYPNPAELQSSTPSHPNPAELQSPTPSHLDPAELSSPSPPSSSHLDPTELQGPSPSHPNPAELQSPTQSHPDPAELPSPSPSYSDPAALQNSPPSHRDPAELQSPSPSYPDPAELQSSTPSQPDPAELPSPAPSYPDPAELQIPALSRSVPAELRSPAPLRPVPAELQSPPPQRPVPAPSQPDPAEPLSPAPSPHPGPAELQHPAQSHAGPIEPQEYHTPFYFSIVVFQQSSTQSHSRPTELQKTPVPSPCGPAESTSMQAQLSLSPQSSTEAQHSPKQGSPVFCSIAHSPPNSSIQMWLSPSQIQSEPAEPQHSPSQRRCSPKKVGTSPSWPTTLNSEFTLDCENPRCGAVQDVSTQGLSPVCYTQTSRRHTSAPCSPSRSPFRPTWTSLSQPASPAQVTWPLQLSPSQTIVSSEQNSTHQSPNLDGQTLESPAQLSRIRELFLVAADGHVQNPSPPQVIASPTPGSLDHVSLTSLTSAASPSHCTEASPIHIQAGLASVSPPPTSELPASPAGPLQACDRPTSVETSLISADAIPVILAQPAMSSVVLAIPGCSISSQDEEMEVAVDHQTEASLCHHSSTPGSPNINNASPNKQDVICFAETCKSHAHPGYAGPSEVQATSSPAHSPPHCRPTNTSQSSSSVSQTSKCSASVTDVSVFCSPPRSTPVSQASPSPGPAQRRSPSIQVTYSSPACISPLHSPAQASKLVCSPEGGPCYYPAGEVPANSISAVHLDHSGLGSAAVSPNQNSQTPPSPHRNCSLASPLNPISPIPVDTTTTQGILALACSNLPHDGVLSTNHANAPQASSVHSSIVACPVCGPTESISTRTTQNPNTEASPDSGITSSVRCPDSSCPVLVTIEKSGNTPSSGPASPLQLRPGPQSRSVDWNSPSAVDVSEEQKKAVEQRSTEDKEEMEQEKPDETEPVKRSEGEGKHLKDSDDSLSGVWLTEDHHASATSPVLTQHSSSCCLPCPPPPGSSSVEASPTCSTLTPPPLVDHPLEEELTNGGQWLGDCERQPTKEEHHLQAEASGRGEEQEKEPLASDKSFEAVIMQQPKSENQERKEEEVREEKSNMEEEVLVSPVLDLDPSLDLEVMELMASASPPTSLLCLSSPSPTPISRQTLRPPLPPPCSSSSRPSDDLAIRLRQSPFSTEASPETSPARATITPPPLTPPLPPLRASLLARESPPLSKVMPPCFLLLAECLFKFKNLKNTPC